jgi:hypothetical protein
MSTSNQSPITSSELGNLWMTYQEKTMLMRFLEHFIEHEDNQQIGDILKSSYDNSSQTLGFIKTVLQEEGSVIPTGFTVHDVNKGVPKLFDFLYNLMYLHMMTKIEINLFALYSTMSYRRDIRQFFKQLTTSSQEIFDQCAQLLLEKGVLARPPYVTMPKEVSFVRDTNYLSGFKLMKETRSLNVIELSQIHHAIENNLTGMQLMIGFAQVASNNEVKKYFVKGMKLSKDVETTLGEYLRADYIEPPATHAGKATNSTIAPFSDKLMIYSTNLLSTFGLGSNAFGSI